MAHKNYSKFSDKFKKSDKESVESNEVVITTAGLAQVIEADTIMDDNPTQGLLQVEETTEALINTKIAVGFVDECDKLYVRKDSSKDSEPLCIIDKLTEVNIDLEKSTEDFYKVYVNGYDGYCMKKFIKIK